MAYSMEEYTILLLSIVEHICYCVKDFNSSEFAMYIC
jgi:hypothetical protein